MQEEYSNKIDNNQKIVIGILVLLSIFIMIAWIAQFKGNIKNHLKEEKAQEKCEQGNCGIEIKDDRFVDTDNDGLSDYDEKNIYDTSPYLEDTDSDGYSDKEEVVSGTDPNCSLVDGCRVEAPESPLEKKEDKVIEENAYKSESTPGFNPSVNTTNKDASEDEVLDMLYSGAGSAEDLRELLHGAGVQKEVLDSISDEVLIESYKELIKNKN